MDVNLEKGTPKVLKEFMDLIGTPTHEKYEETSSYLKDLKHPDVEYFRKVKDKNHFKYHRAKHSRNHAEKIQAMMTTFNPYSREALLERISTYSAMNWNVPLHSKVTELKCARKGWACMSFSQSSNGKNHLFCDWCGMQLILAYNEPGQTSAVPFEFDMEDIKELNSSLDDFYIEKIEHSGHHKSCSWRNFETPLEGCYYLRPYLQSTNEILTLEYLNILKHVSDNKAILDKFTETMTIVMPPELNQDQNFKRFMRISSDLLLDTFYKHEKENMLTKFSTIPKWYFHVAILGWDFKVQSFADKLVYMLICSKCNQRVFMTYDIQSPLEKGDSSSLKQSTNLSVSESCILTPCQNPITISTEDHFEFDGEVDENVFDPFTEHKEWCQYLKGMEDDISFYSYFISMLTGVSNTNANMNMEITDDGMNKRRRSIDINDGMKRLSKLRKLYLIDE